jgi:hypothetical protein
MTHSGITDSLVDDMNYIPSGTQYNPALALISTRKDVVYMHHSCQTCDVREKQGVAVFFRFVCRRRRDIAGNGVTPTATDCAAPSLRDLKRSGQRRKRWKRVPKSDEGIVQGMIRVPEQGIA